MVCHIELSDSSIKSPPHPLSQLPPLHSPGKCPPVTLLPASPVAPPAVPYHLALAPSCPTFYSPAAAPLPPIPPGPHTSRTTPPASWDGRRESAWTPQLTQIYDRNPYLHLTLQVELHRRPRRPLRIVSLQPSQRQQVIVAHQVLLLGVRLGDKRDILQIHDLGVSRGTGAAGLHSTGTDAARFSKRPASYLATCPTDERAERRIQVVARYPGPALCASIRRGRECRRHARGLHATIRRQPRARRGRRRHGSRPRSSPAHIAPVVLGVRDKTAHVVPLSHMFICHGCEPGSDFSCQTAGRAMSKDTFKMKLLERV